MLSLAYCKNVTDVSVRTLKQLKRLEMLTVAGTKITDRGKAALKAAIPGLKFDNPFR